MKNRWNLYVLPPIDFGLEHLRSAEETLKTFKHDEANLKKSDFKYDLAYRSKNFEMDWGNAKLLAEELGMSSALKEVPAVFWVPDDGQLTYSFVFKGQDNGTTYVVSPVELPWLKAISMTNDLLNSKVEGITGTYKQVKWAQDIVVDALRNYDEVGKKIPSLNEACLALSEILTTKRDASWLIEHRDRLQFLLSEKNGMWEVAPHTIRQHPILLTPPIGSCDALQHFIEIPDDMGIYPDELAYVIARDYGYEYIKAKPRTTEKGLEKALMKHMMSLDGYRNNKTNLHNQCRLASRRVFSNK